jgi:flavin reductase (DIM6/NTAB) family NADH-FMN oxidoreductase RutF
VTQCSIVPPNFLVCISTANHTFGVAQRSTAMGLHLLGAHQVDLARHFGEETGDLVDKFAGLDWRPGPHGAPLLAACAVSLEGVILGHFSVGDHEAFLVRGSDSFDGGHPGLLTYRTGPPFSPGHPVPA